MKVTIRVSGEREGSPSTETSVIVEQEAAWIWIGFDSTSRIDECAMRPTEARMLATALEHAAQLAEKQQAMR